MDQFRLHFGLPRPHTNVRDMSWDWCVLKTAGVLPCRREVLMALPTLSELMNIREPTIPDQAKPIAYEHGTMPSAGGFVRYLKYKVQA